MLRVGERHRSRLLDCLSAGFSYTDVLDREIELDISSPCVVVTSDDVVGIGTLKRGRRFTTNQRLVRLFAPEAVGPWALETITDLMAAGQGSRVTDAAQTGGVLPPTTWDAFVAAIRQVDPDAAGRLNIDQDRLVHPTEVTVQLEERDAVLVSLEIAGLRRSILKAQPSPSVHFLEDVGSFEPTEDQQVIHDAETLPGWVHDLGNDLTAAHAFMDESGSRRLLVMNVNRTRIERTTGVDLLYWRQDPESFVLVQYKRLKNEGGVERFRPSADPNFAIERQRMVDLRMKLIATQGPQLRPEHFRLSSDPFYFKFCSPVQAVRSPDELMKGMYVPLDYWDLLEAAGVAKGPKGGVVIDRENARRWLTNTLFTTLVGEAWLGTYAGASAYLTELVREGLHLRRSVMVATELMPRPRGRRA